MQGRELSLGSADATLDVSGQKCFMPVVSARRTILDADDGDLMAIRTGKPFDEIEDVEGWCSKLDGADLLGIEEGESGLVAYLERKRA